MVELPITNDGMVTDGGMGYEKPSPPTTDAASMPPLNLTIAGIPEQQYSGMACEQMSKATDSMDAPPLGAFLKTNVHDENWLDPLKPNISTEDQRG